MQTMLPNMTADDRRVMSSIIMEADDFPDVLNKMGRYYLSKGDLTSALMFIQAASNMLGTIVYSKLPSATPP